MADEHLIVVLHQHSTRSQTQQSFTQTTVDELRTGEWPTVPTVTGPPAVPIRQEQGGESGAQLEGDVPQAHQLTLDRREVDAQTVTEVSVVCLEWLYHHHIHCKDITWIVCCLITHQCRATGYGYFPPDFYPHWKYKCRYFPPLYKFAFAPEAKLLQFNAFRKISKIIRGIAGNCLCWLFNLFWYNILLQR